MSDNRPVFVNGDIATQVLDLMEEIAQTSSSPMPVEFGELTADAGRLPRLMIAPVNADETSQRYISGESVVPFAFALYLRQSIMDEQERLDAHAYLTEVTEAFLPKSQVLNGYVAFRKPQASMPVELGATNAFEDWQVTVKLTFKQTSRKG